ncbi:ABC transporter permease subunit [Litorivicinus lipolyticus]|uniref:ABC transporter permease subunit n=1 Tax=Litorivicinus lipolyticus TaxID=418701 RepID=A0A5Q2QB64_9GAMM|nr:ABC transporter permease subunit [Litorivicinus lipolyticus]QGG79050.1 ABC transporter permease subunit [Litorivicinus lipolyticus]
MGRALRALVWLTLAAAFGLPLALGLAGTAIAAAGAFPGSPVAGWMAAIGDPRLGAAITSTLWTGLGATALALLLALLALVIGWGRPWFRAVAAWLPPMLAVPHAALAVGLVFVLAPSGWLVRLWLDSPRPPTWWTVPDAYGLSLLVGLALKEFPFLLFTALALCPRLDPDRWIKQGRVLGYSPIRCWTRLVLPQLLHQLRLPIAVVLAYNLSVVDMAILLGPGQPPTLAALVLEWFNQAGGRAKASAGAWLLLAVMGVGFALFAAFGWVVRIWARRRRVSGARAAYAVWLWPARALLAATVAVAALALASLPLWSLTQRWRFPDSLPGAWTTRFWLDRWNQLGELLSHTLILGLASTALAIAAAVIWLELERLRHVPRLDGIWTVPLLLPQVCVLLGWQSASLWIGWDGRAATVIWAHWVYSLPYVILMLADAWRALDPAFDKQARVLGHGYLTRLWRIRLPLMARPLLSAAAVAMAVSVAQYLPTLLLSGGRIPTLTTELVTSFGGVDRRMIGALATLQLALPLVCFGLALVLPRIWFRNRKHA